MSLHLVPFGLALGVNPCTSLGHVFARKDPFFPRQFRKSSLIVEPPTSRVFMQTPPREKLGRIYNIVTSRKQGAEENFNNGSYRENLDELSFIVASYYFSEC